ncbi:hypothetical protein D5F01_LYC02584 [Larimichthys crocea]|uniref:T-cell surface glycoprotein CD8 beta chain n=1 Tax=Larimichthys crocea TaxID=215358 RepID=A0A6G0J3N0_LARCR|nr:hypothetical protein D5F01_LYC02584 [Larimichthys crocea]
MIPPLAWTLLIVSLLTSGSSEILQQETIKVLYPKISSTENIDCECNMSFESVHWFRSISKYSKIQYIGKCNNADRDFYGTDVDKARYKISRKMPPPTLPPKIQKPKPPTKPRCTCPKKNPSQDGCDSLILWPLVGLMAALTLALVCTLYYFSRLPKKCRHHFVKKR